MTKPDSLSVRPTGAIVHNSDSKVPLVRFTVAALLAALSLLVIPLLVSGQDTNNSPHDVQSSDPSTGPKKDPVAGPTPPQDLEIKVPISGKQPVPEADAASGALTYQIKVPIPPGRFGVQPDLGLVYNSLNSDFGSLVGYGWELSLPSIERRNVNGVNLLYSSRAFTSSLSGELREQSSGTFFARVDTDSALRYEFLGSGNGQYWKVTDKQGKQYFFGESATSKLSDPIDDNKIFRWYLTKILDRNGNSVDFIYQKFNSQVYLQEIDYTGHLSASGVFKVVPEYEDRPDVTAKANQGFLINTTKRLTKIKAFFANQLTNETDLTYVQHPVNKQSLLRSVRNTGYNVQGQSASLGNWTFDYDSTGATCLMTDIQLPTGGKMSVSYVPSAQVIDNATNNLGNGKMPYSFYLVQKIEYLETGNPTRQETFQYTGGAFYFSNPLDKRVAGFEKVVQTDGAGNTTTTFYHQGNGNNAALGEVGDQYEKLGRAYKVETRSASGALFTWSYNRWEYLGAGPNLGRTQLKSTLTKQFDGNQDSKASAVEYQYDSFANIATETKLGEVSGNDDGSYVDIGTDTIISSFAYASPVDSSSYVVGLPSQQRVADGSNNKKNETLYYYDGLVLNSVDKGNSTTEQRWIVAAAYAETNKTFDGFGQVVRVTDPNNNPMAFVFDQFNLYPASVINALGQTVQYVYDYSSGKINRTIDANGRVFETDYDGLGRVIGERQPDPSNPSALVTKSLFEYTDQPNNVSIKKTARLDESLTVESYAYSDGFGRTVQERQQADGAGQFKVIDRTFDNRGLPERESLPYFSAGSGRTPPISETYLYTGYNYDPLRRVLGVTNSLGATTSSYDNWKTTVTDAVGKSKTLYKNAFDQIVRVDERNGAETYATRYDYDPMGSLLRITDARGNIRNFSYDGLGRRTIAEDLHGVGDGTFGLWQFTYDNANNLTQRIDPNGQTVNFEYDGLNRVKNEDFQDQKGTEVNYFYDSCPDGIGRLCGDFTTTVSRNREYSGLGQIKKETTTITGVPYITHRDFNYQGDMRLLTNPDGSQVKYDYNEAGLLDGVSTKEQAQAGFSAIVTDFKYSPTDAPAEIVYASGTLTVNTYDPDELYRLKRKYTTVNNGAGVVQDLNYSFDAVGNVRRISDNAETNSLRTLRYLYDDLHRLVYAAERKANGQRGYRHSFSYDALGNLTNKSDLGAYQYTGNQGISYANPHAATFIGATPQTYDRNGNLVSVGGQTSYTWDYNNRLRQTDSGGNIVVFDYTSDGERVTYDNGSSTTITPSIFFSVNKTTGVEKHVYAGGTMLATIRGTGPQAAIFYDHTDHLSGANVVTSEGGKVAERLEYYPFGSILLDSGIVSERRKFGGHEFDPETGLSYMGARYYDAAQGRFISLDPVFLSMSSKLSDPQGFNSYSYSRNNPLRYVDPDGKWFREFFSGHQSWNSFVVEVGDAANTLHDSNPTWRAALDHPVAAGAVVGVAGGLTATGAIAAGPAKALTGAGLNVSQTFLTSKAENRDASLGEYLMSAASGVWGPKGPLGSASYAGGVNIVQQYLLNGKVDPRQAAISATSASVSAGLINSSYARGSGEGIKFLAEKSVNWVTETSGQLIYQGVQKQSEDKKGLR